MSIISEVKKWLKTPNIEIKSGVTEFDKTKSYIISFPNSEKEDIYRFAKIFRKEMKKKGPSIIFTNQKIHEVIENGN